MKIGFRRDAGMVRDNNEDWLIIDDEIGLFLVADGLGGHQAGETASRTGAEIVQAVIKARLSGGVEHSMETLIKEAIDRAHNEILSEASNDPNLSGMGTTIVLGLYHDGKLYIAHVGDSRAYFINTSSISVLTEDHSLVGGLVRAGRITEEKARNHKMRHIITQCLGSSNYSGPEVKSLSFPADDVLLLCSDGLTDMIEDHLIQEVVLKYKRNLQKCADKLVKLANNKGGYDNITVVLVAADNGEGVSKRML